jgi:thioredoxin reductase
VHNYLGREGTPPSELVAIGRAEVESYGGEVVTGRVVSISTREPPRDVPEFRVVLADGGSVLARRLLVTTGLVDELPDLPGLTERWGRDVLHCPYCHGYEVRDRPVGVLGSGPTAVHQALLFRQWTDDVTLFVHTAPALTDEQCEQLDARGITVVTGLVAGLEVADDRLVGLRLRSGGIVEREAVVVAPRFTARSDVLAGLGLEPTDMEMGGHVIGSYVATDATGATAVPGVYAAGNVTDLRAQVIGAAAGGLNAAAMLNADLVGEDTRLAVASRRAAGVRRG